MNLCAEQKWQEELIFKPFFNKQVKGVIKNMTTIKQYDILKFIKDIIIPKEDTVIVEYSLTILLNRKEFITLLCTPKSLKELVIGFLYSEGVIRSKDEIKDMKIVEEKGKAYVEISNEDSFKYVGDNLLIKKTVTLGCGKGKTIVCPTVDLLKKINHSLEIKPKKILRLMHDFSKNSQIFIETGGVHSCALCSEDEILLFEEDAGRHNALDKILGRALLEDINLEDKIVLTTGRISSEILTKVAKRKIPMLVSRSAPTDVAIDMARKLNIALIGFARGQKMNIYTNK